MAITQVRETEKTGTGAGKGWALALLAVAQLMIVLDASVVVVALPSAQRALHISAANRQWALSAYTLAFGTLLLLGGRLADYLGRRRMLITGLLGFAGASALGGLAQSGAMLFGARALQGAFAALMAPASLSLLSVTFSEARERARAFGVYGAVAGGGAALGLVLGGSLTDLASWRWTLLINVPIALVAAWATPRVLAESRLPTGRGYDLRGASLVTAGMFLLVYGFTTAGTDGWGSPTTLALLVGALVTLGAFVAWERRSPNPLLPLRVALEPRRAGALLTSLLMGIALLGTFLFLTYFMQGIKHESALATGFAFLPFSGGVIAGSMVASRFLPRLGARTLMLSGLAMSTVGLVLFTHLHASSAFVSGILPAEIVLSTGLGLTFVPMNSTALSEVTGDDAGVASALVNATQQVGGSLGIALLNSVAASATASFLAARVRSFGPGAIARFAPAATVHGFVEGFEVSAAMLVAAFVAVGLLLQRPAAHSEPLVLAAVEPGEAGEAPEAA